METRPCPNCTKSIDANATECPNCRVFVVWPDETAMSPTGQAVAQAGRSVGKTLWWAVGGGGGLVVGLILLVLSWATPSTPPGLRVVIENNVISPASVRIREHQVLAQEGDWYMVWSVIDAKNAFGVPLRNAYCVTYRRDGDIVKWSRIFGFQECAAPPGPDMIEEWKKLNKWGGSGD